MKEKEKKDKAESTKAADEEVKEAEKEEEKKESDGAAAEEKEVSETDKLKAQLAEKEDKFLRLMAEYDNFRKRTQKEKSDIYSSSKSEVINDILPVIDNFDRAAANTDADFESYRKGIEMIFGQFEQILKKYGVESFGERGEEFDPAIHQAVNTASDDELPENTITQVYSKGYKMGDKIIRSAVVVVNS